MSYENIDDCGRIVRCQKPHKCEWCGTWIWKGQKAVTRTYKFAGEFNSSHLHPECYIALSESAALSLLDYDNSFDWGEQERGYLVGE